MATTKHTPTFTAAQLVELAPYAENFRTAVRSRFARRVSPDGARRIADIYFDATGIRLSVYPSCQDCMLRLLTTVGRKYLDDVDTQLAGEAPKHEVSEGPAPEKPLTKVEVKNSGKGGKGKKTK